MAIFGQAVPYIGSESTYCQKWQQFESNYSQKWQCLDKLSPIYEANQIIAKNGKKEI